MKKLSNRLSAAIAPVLFILLLAAASSQALAQNPGDAPPPGDQAPANQGENLGKLLGLTPDQMEKIRAIRQENAGEGQAIRRRVRQAQRALDQAIYSDNTDEAGIERLARELSDAQAAEVRMRAMTELKIRRVLTAEQLTTFRRIRQERLRAQMERRLENGDQQRPLGNQRPANAINQVPLGDRNEARSNANGQGDRKALPALTPRERRALRKIRP
jgi:Spy/CpxP family protein refolding chaperone